MTVQINLSVPVFAVARTIRANSSPGDSGILRSRLLSISHQIALYTGEYTFSLLFVSLSFFLSTYVHFTVWYRVKVSQEFWTHQTQNLWLFYILDKLQGSKVTFIHSTTHHNSVRMNKH